MKRAILLDALGTLLALEPPAAALRDELGARFGVSVELEVAEHAIATEIAYYRRHLDEGRDARSLNDLRSRCAEALRGPLSGFRALASADHAELKAALLAALRFTVFDDVAGALRLARRRGIRLVVVSNWDYSLHDVLADRGVAPLLDGIVTSAEIGVRKPAPEIFAHALELVGVPAADALHVGDSLREDVEGARAAGIEPVLLVRERMGGVHDDAVAGVRTISSLAEL